MARQRLPVLIVWLTVLVAGCGDNVAAPGAEAIVVEPSSVQLEVDETTTIAADYQAAGSRVPANDAVWMSSDPDKVTVDGSGASVTIRALAMGSATVTASGSGFSATVTVTVGDPTLERIAITPAVPKVPVGTTLPIMVMATFSDGSTADVTAMVAWISDKPTIATVANGTLSGLARGEAQITATYMDLFSSTRATVTAPTLTSIDVTPVSAMVSVGTTQQFVATGHFSDSTTSVITTTRLLRSGKTRSALSSRSIT